MISTDIMILIISAKSHSTSILRKPLTRVSWSSDVLKNRCRDARHVVVGRLRPKLWIAGHGRILNIWRSEISNRWVIWTAPKGHLAHLGTLKGLKKFFILAFSLTIPYAPRCWYIYLQNRVIFRANVGKLFQHHGSHMGMWLAESINFLDTSLPRSTALRSFAVAGAQWGTVCWQMLEKTTRKTIGKGWKLCQHFPDGFMAQKWMFSCAVFAVEKSTISDIFNSNFQYSTPKDSNIFWVQNLPRSASFCWCHVQIVHVFFETS